MNELASVTMICATLNAREAVKLTLSSLHRYTPEPHCVLVADNGSEDGTLSDLLAIPWLRVIPVEQRRAMMRAETEHWEQSAIELDEKLKQYSTTLSPEERTALSTIRAFKPRFLAPDDHGSSALHGQTLDWLAAQVETPFLLTLDSDVEFLAEGWLTEMISLMKRENLVALGEYQAGHRGYRSRLAPHLLLLRTDSFRSLGAYFRASVTIDDPDEAQQWHARPRSFNLGSGELDKYQTVTVYPTGAALLERIQERGARWSDLPDSIAQKFRHLGHMSWSGSAPLEVLGSDGLRSHYAQALSYIRERLSLYR